MPPQHNRSLTLAARMVAITRSKPIFTKNRRATPDSRCREKNRKPLPIGRLLRIRISALFFGTVVATNKGRPDRFAEAWSGARSVGQRFPPPFDPRFPVRVVGPRGLLRDSPRLLDAYPGGTAPKASAWTRFSHPPHAYNTSQRTPLPSPSLPPRRASLFFLDSSKIPLVPTLSERVNFLSLWLDFRPRRR